MSVLFSPWANSQFFDENGNPAIGWKIYSYAAGSSTPLATYTDSTGATPQSNPIIINALGFPTTGQVWLTSAVPYKLVLTDASDVVKKTEDNISGVATTQSAASQWVESGLTPTYISATQFSLVGDQTSAFEVGRRVKTTNTSGTIYSKISVSAFTTLTTVTVVNDSGVLDSGLSAVSYGLLTATNQSIPNVPTATTATNIAGGAAGQLPIQTGAGATGFIPLGQIQPLPTPTLSANALTLPTATYTLDFRNATLATGGAPTTISAAIAAATIPSTATLGTTNAVQSDIYVLALNNAGTMEYAFVNSSGGVDLTETGLISTTALSAGSTSATVVYSTTARTNVAYRVIGLIRSTQATAGTWVTAPSLVQGMGGNTYKQIPIGSMIRLATRSGYGATNTKIPRFVTTLTNQGSDITYADSATFGGSFTINTNGVYAVSFSSSETNAADMGLSLNTTQPTTAITLIPTAEILANGTSAAANYNLNVSWIGYLASGSVVRMHTDGVADGSRPTLITISRVS